MSLHSTLRTSAEMASRLGSLPKAVFLLSEVSSKSKPSLDSLIDTAKALSQQGYSCSVYGSERCGSLFEAIPVQAFGESDERWGKTCSNGVDLTLLRSDDLTLLRSEDLEQNGDLRDVRVVVAPGFDSADPLMNGCDAAIVNLFKQCAISGLALVSNDDISSFVHVHNAKVSSVPHDVRKKYASNAFEAAIKLDKSYWTKVFSEHSGRTVLVLGAGGREHALAQSLSLSPQVARVLVGPGNGGTDEDRCSEIHSTTANHSNDNSESQISKISNAPQVSLAKENLRALVPFCQTHGVDLVVVGPEQPLIDGVVDLLSYAGIAVFGPSKAASRIEGSKSWAKAFFTRHGLPTAVFQTFTDPEKAKIYVNEQFNELNNGQKVVIKVSGVAAGKGVLLPESAEEGVRMVEDVMETQIFGEAGAEIVVEERLYGHEFSLLAFCDGDVAVCMPAAQDHKRAFNGDTGPNTGGMGAYAPAPLVSPALFAECSAIVQRTVDAMREEGTPFKGCLFAGFMGADPKLLEFNCRMGDPETQAILPLLHAQCDLFEVLSSCATTSTSSTDGYSRDSGEDSSEKEKGGKLRPCTVRFRDDLSACAVVCAAPGYPGTYEKGLEITGLEQVCRQTAHVFHAGTCVAYSEESQGRVKSVKSTGGRVLTLTGVGPSIRAAAHNAYAAATYITFTPSSSKEAGGGTEIGIQSALPRGVQYRTDVARLALDGRPVVLGVLCSSRGTAMQGVIDAVANGSLNARVAVVVSDREDSGCLQRARESGINAVYVSAYSSSEGAGGNDIPKSSNNDSKYKISKKTKMSRTEYDEKVSSVLAANGCDLVLLAGYMRIVSPAFISRWRYRALNVHPSLLPAFSGLMDLAVHEAVLLSGKKESGCTVHLVTEEVDGGAIVSQRRVAVEVDDTVETLRGRVQAQEGPTFKEAIQGFRDRVMLQGEALEDWWTHWGTTDKLTLTYRDAGVNIDAGDALVQRIKPLCRATNRPGCEKASIGGFGGLFDLAAAGLGQDLQHTSLVAGCDGVGTKLKIAQAVGDHSTIGIDLVAMCVNDILVCGAIPLFFLDYYATGCLDVDTAEKVVRGIARGCCLSGCALIGGETAEMGGMYTKGEYDLAGFAVGAVDKRKLLPRLDMAAGDILVGLPSSGVHSNGFSLVRKCVEKSGLEWGDECPYSLSEDSELGRRQAAGGLVTIGQALLIPTRLYVTALLPLLQKGLLKGIVHVTGGGLLDNIPRVLPKDVRAELCTATFAREDRDTVKDKDSYRPGHAYSDGEEWDEEDTGTAFESGTAGATGNTGPEEGWRLPPVFCWLQQHCNLSQTELLRTFNCGIGMVLVVASADTGEVLRELANRAEQDNDEGAKGACVIGKLVGWESSQGPQVVLKGTLE